MELKSTHLYHSQKFMLVYYWFFLLILLYIIILSSIIPPSEKKIFLNFLLEPTRKRIREIHFHQI